MRKNGFTIIELIIVVMIIAVLAAVAIPKFIDLSATAKKNAVLAVAGSISSSNGQNYAARIISSSLGVAISNCTDAASLIEGGLPPDYTIIPTAISTGTTATCILVAPGGSSIDPETSANFQATGIA